MKIIENININNVKEFLIKLFREFFFIIIVISSFTLGYFSRVVHHDINNKKNVEIKRMKDLSISIETTGNLIIIDKVSGDLTKYDDSVGIALFNFYASKIIYDINNKK